MINRIIGITASALFIFVMGATAQTMTTTLELKRACETSPNNIVNLNVNTQISSGPQTPLTEFVNTKCTLVISPLVTFEASQVSMTFNGPFRVQAGNEGHVLFIESAFTAPAISITQISKSKLEVERSLLRALAGSIVINSGTEGSVDVKGPLVGGNLVATGAISINGGTKFFGSFADAGASAGTGISVNMTGAEAQFIAVTSTLAANNGAINVQSSGDKSYAEFKLGSVVSSPRGVSVRLNGNESEIVASQFTLDGGTGIILRTGGNKGKVTMADGSAIADAAILVQSSTTGRDGVVVAQNATFNSGTATRFETGSFGNTEVLDSGLTAGTLVRIATGLGGTCKSQNNIISAASQQICQ